MITRQDYNILKNAFDKVYTQKEELRDLALFPRLEELERLVFKNPWNNLNDNLAQMRSYAISLEQRLMELEESKSVRHRPRSRITITKGKNKVVIH